jgi:hypothetical protein
MPKHNLGYVKKLIIMDVLGVYSCLGLATLDEGPRSRVQ